MEVLSDQLNVIQPNCEDDCLRYFVVLHVDIVGSLKELVVFGERQEIDHADHVKTYPAEIVFVQKSRNLLDHLKLAEQIHCICFGIVTEKVWNQRKRQLHKILDLPLVSQPILILLAEL